MTSAAGRRSDSVLHFKEVNPSLKKSVTAIKGMLRWSGEEKYVDGKPRRGEKGGEVGGSGNPR